MNHLPQWWFLYTLTLPLSLLLIAVLMAHFDNKIVIEG